MVSRYRTDAGRSENEEVRAYILAMASELAEMAEKIDEPDLAERLRLEDWLARPRRAYGLS